MDSQTFTILAFFVLFFSLISGRIQKSVITAPMIFVLFGFLASPKGFGFVTFHAQEEAVKILTELTLIIILFIDAASIDFKTLRKQMDIPLRLLGIGMPLTILLGTIIAAQWFSFLSFWEAAVLAAILAPTDAALGQLVVSDKRIPVRIRQGLNVESGLNDGIALPVVLIFLAIAGASGTSAQYWVKFTASQVILGPLVGVGVGFFGGKLIELANMKKAMNHSYAQISGVAIALLSYFLAEYIGGNGFMAAFAAGLTIGNTTKAVCECFYEFAEAQGQLLELFTFLIFGNIMLSEHFQHISLSMVIYAVLSLTVIRMVPVLISLIGLKLKWETKLLLGWFGPRGLASILFGLIVLERVNIVHTQEIYTIIITTVLLSIFAHGFTAFPAVSWYAGCRDPKKLELPEFLPVNPMPSEQPRMVKHGV